MRRNILLTGRPGIGKSTVIRKVIGVLGETQFEGFWTSEVRLGTERVGFSISTIDGQQGMLAGMDSYSGPRIGRYIVNVPDIDRIIVPTLRRARETGKTIVIDEIASMELTSPGFAPEVRKCLDTRRVLGTLQQKGGSFVQEVKERLDVVVLELTILNRDLIHRDILSMLRQQ
ncbi:MAG: AAA family ATPase [Candidatus Thorarchaeota archaeon]|nr:MAG: AAA family ATPase [Candidatus Thorarchaeota archaeon]